MSESKLTDLKMELSVTDVSILWPLSPPLFPFLVRARATYKLPQFPFVFLRLHGHEHPLSISLSSSTSLYS